MVETPIIGIENELLVDGLSDSQTYLREHFKGFVDNLEMDYWGDFGCKKVRFSNGGVFYIDGSAPEVTSAPFHLEPGSVTKVANNLFLGTNDVLNAFRKNGFELVGYSAHYNFTFPHIKEKDNETMKILAQSGINPVTQLFLENRESKGVMFRYRSGRRLEICGDYLTKLDDVICANAFQAALLKRVDELYKGGKSEDDLVALLRYRLSGEVQRTGTRSGYILKTPEVIKGGRDGKLVVKDLREDRTIELTVQDLLDYYKTLLDDSVLSNSEKEILHSSIEGKRLIPIDIEKLPPRYNIVRTVEIGESQSELSQAYGKAIKEREIGGLKLKPTSVEWKTIQYKCDDVHFMVKQESMVSFENLLKNPDLFKAVVTRDMSNSQVQELEGIGLIKNGTLSINIYYPGLFGKTKVEDLYSTPPQPHVEDVRIKLDDKVIKQSSLSLSQSYLTPTLSQSPQRFGETNDIRTSRLNILDESSRMGRNYKWDYSNLIHILSRGFRQPNKKLSQVEDISNTNQIVWANDKFSNRFELLSRIMSSANNSNNFSEFANGF
jgi:hypothetical protein